MVYLIESPKVLKSGKRVTYYVLRWSDSRGKYREKSLGRSKTTGGTMTKREAEKERERFEHSLVKGDVPRDRPKSMTLGVFYDHYRERRRQGQSGRGYLRGAPKLSESTITDHSMTLRYLNEHFGAARSIDSISIADAEAFIESLVDGDLVEARENRNESTPDRAIGEQTVRKHIRNAKAAFNWARRFGYVTGNPFDDFDGKPLPSRPCEYVTINMLEEVLQRCPSDGWRCLFALCRLAGLRRSEAIELPWKGYRKDRQGVEHEVGIDWKARRISLVAKKTRMHRVLPISPRLFEILDEAYVNAANGAGTVTGLSEHNLTRLGKEIVSTPRADDANPPNVTPWPKLYQALRASCENDWKTAGVAEPTYAAWLGHSPTVSRRHYVSPTDQEFAAIAFPSAA